VTAVPEGPADSSVSVGEDDDLARELAAAAGALLMDIRRRMAEGLSPDEARRLGDRQSHELLAGELRRRRPADAVLSEEGDDDTRRLSAARVWIVDPLDGTREFGEPPNPDWAVHVALWANGSLVAGAVALPATGVVASGRHVPAVPAMGSRIRLAVSRTRPPAIAERLSDALGADLVPMGSAGAKVMAVVSGAVDAYAHAGGQYEWDSAAPVVIARAAGLHATRLAGDPLRYNQADPWLPDLLVCRPELAERIMAVAESERTDGPGRLRRRG
jgi:3'(2'), 5'-bisphosphate nucleotidase